MGAAGDVLSLEWVSGTLGQPFSILLSSTIIFTDKRQLFLPLFSQHMLLQLLLRIGQTWRIFSVAVTDGICHFHRTFTSQKPWDRCQVAASKVTRLNSLKSSRVGSWHRVCSSDAGAQMCIFQRQQWNVAFPSPASWGAKLSPGIYRNNSFSSLEHRDAQYAFL